MMRIAIVCSTSLVCLVLITPLFAQEGTPPDDKNPPPDEDVTKPSDNEEESAKRLRLAFTILREKAEKYLNEAEKKEVAKKSYTADLAIYKNSNSGIQRSKGKLYVKNTDKGTKVLWVESDAQGQVINRVLLAGKYLISLYPAKGYYDEYSLEKKDLYTIQFPLSFGFSSTLFNGFNVIGVSEPPPPGEGVENTNKETVEGDNLWQDNSPPNAESVEFIPKEEWLKGLVSSLKIYFDRDTFFIKQVDMKDAKGGRVAARLYNIKPATDIDDNTFRLNLSRVRRNKAN